MYCSMPYSPEIWIVVRHVRSLSRHVAPRCRIRLVALCRVGQSSALGAMSEVQNVLPDQMLSKLYKLHILSAHAESKL